MLRAVSDQSADDGADHRPLIRLDGVGKDFPAPDGERRALRDVSLSVRRGEIVGIAGAAGAGKSTLLRTMNLLERPDRGSVVVAGQDLARLPHRALRTARQAIGMIFPQPHLLDNLTAADNVALPLRLHGTLNAPRLERRVRDCLARVGMDTLSDVLPAGLTPAQRQRVAIARAIAGQPDILLCDDPTAALDRETARAILSLLCELNATLGTTIVVASHDLAALGALCRRVVVLEDGAVAESVDLAARTDRDAAARPRRTAIGRELACYGVELRALLGKGVLHA